MKYERGLEKVFGDKNLHAFSRIFYASFMPPPYYFYSGVIYIQPHHETLKEFNGKPTNIGH